MSTGNGRPTGESYRQRLALGLKFYLNRFAAEHQALTWKQLASDDPANWRYYVLIALNDAETEILFNLQGVAVGAGLLRAASGRGSSTDWELLTIQQNPEWWPRIRWFLGDLSVANPFETDGQED